jgi:aryl-alcohol dehydrogenase-like predicted oxidoreductase
VELGVNFFDTADAYGTGHSEEVLGEALKGMRDKVVIATKGGFVHDRAARALIGEDTTPAYIRKALAASLTRLGTDYVDLYQIHNGAMPPEHFEPLFHELDKFVAEGKVRAYGWSTWSAENVDKFAAKTRGAVIQTKQNMLSYDGALSDACVKHGLGCIANGPLGMGLLSGKFSAQTRFSPDDVRSAAHDWTEYFENGVVKQGFLDKLESVREILKSGGRTVAQGALAWLWARSACNIPIPGFKNVRQAEENAAAMEFGPLTKSQMDEIETLLGRG